MDETREVELRYISAGSMFKFFGGVFFLFGLVVGLLTALFGVRIPGQFTDSVPFLARSGGGFLIALISAVIYGIVGGIVYSLTALAYNFFAAVLGGIRIFIRE